MTLVMLLTAFVAGILIMMPVGPVSTICIRRSLLFGPWAGILAGAGDAIAVATYATIGVAGSTLLIRLFAPYTTFAHIIIATALFIVAIIIWRAKPKLPDVAMPSRTNLATGLFAALMVALANPADIVLFAALFTGLGVVVHSPLDHVLFFLAVFAGGCVYWVSIALFLNKWRKSFNGPRILWLNRACSILLALAGCSSLVSLARG